MILMPDETNESTIYRTTTHLKRRGVITLVIPKAVREAYGLSEGDSVGIAIFRPANDEKVIEKITSRMGKIKHIKKAIKGLQETHTDGKLYVNFAILTISAGEAGIEEAELAEILEYLKNCGDVIELPKNCWRLV